MQKKSSNPVETRESMYDLNGEHVVDWEEHEQSQLELAKKEKQLEEEKKRIALAEETKRKDKEEETKRIAQAKENERIAEERKKKIMELNQKEEEKEKKEKEAFDVLSKNEIDENYLKNLNNFEKIKENRFLLYCFCV
jgi:hypothetical protein